MAAVARAEILTKFQGMVARGEPIVGGGAGTGISAKAEEAGRPHHHLQFRPLSHGAIAAAASKVRDDVIVLCHGGPIAMPENAGFVLERVKGCHGF
jgi:predicted TIM-barrel enzyme